MVSKNACIGLIVVVIAGAIIAGAIFGTSKFGKKDDGGGDDGACGDDDDDCTLDIYDNSPTEEDDYGTREFSYLLDVQIRDQWDPNSGFCGETSAIVAGQLLAGQYFSQYDLRLIYCSHEDSSLSDSECITDYQYLVGDSDFDLQTAASLRLSASSYPSSSPPGASAYLAWVKSHVRQGHVVTITLFNNGGEQDEYDHIVDVVGIETDYDDDDYHADDLLIYDDHYESTYRISFGDFPRTRAEADEDDAPQWSLPKGVANYGIAHLGPLGAGLQKVSIWTSVRSELPAIKEGEGSRPLDGPMTVYVRVTGLQTGKTYNLYMFDDENDVPVSDFNSHAEDAVDVTTFEAEEDGTYEFDFEARTSDKIIFRCVEA